MLARSVTHALVGLEPRRVEVEAHIDGGVPGFAIVGLDDQLHVFLGLGVIERRHGGSAGQAPGARGEAAR